MNIILLVKRFCSRSMERNEWGFSRIVTSGKCKYQTKCKQFYAIEESNWRTRTGKFNHQYRTCINRCVNGADYNPYTKAHTIYANQVS